jgi:hypothetical protein
MSTRLYNATAAGGLGDPLQQVPLLPIIANREPTTSDYAPLGTIWDFKAQNLLWIISSIVNQVATWIPINQIAGALVEYDATSITNNPVILAGFPLGPNTEVTINATISGATPDMALTGGGVVIGTFARAAAGGPFLVGAIDNGFSQVGNNLVVNFQFVGNTVALVVNGPLGTIVNWKSLIYTVSLP